MVGSNAVKVGLDPLKISSNPKLYYSNPLKADSTSSAAESNLHATTDPAASNEGSKSTWHSLFHSKTLPSINIINLTTWMVSTLFSSPIQQVVVRQIWGRRDRVDVIDLDNGFFLFKIENS